MGKTYRLFDDKTGVALVTIKDQFGVAEGRAKVHEEDMDLMSAFTGLQIAQLKAEIKRAKNRKVASREVLRKARNEVRRAFNHYKDRVETQKELELELEIYLKEKEEFRQNYRRMKARRAIDTSKPK